MNFQSLFKEYTPVEYGDFFRLYRINNRGYLIYCNENNVICCMELYGFTDISVIMLAELLKVNLEELEDCEEFSLPVRCSRQQIIDYLFDVSAKETYVKLKHVSGLHGYLLKSIHQDKSGLNAYRNLFQFDPVKGNTRLLFDDNKYISYIKKFISEGLHSIGFFDDYDTTEESSGPLDYIPNNFYSIKKSKLILLQNEIPWKYVTFLNGELQIYNPRHPDGQGKYKPFYYRTEKSIKAFNQVKRVYNK